jgi:hypothetical protein
VALIAAVHGSSASPAAEFQYDGFIGLDSDEPDFKHMKPACVQALKEYAKKEGGMKKPAQLVTKEDCESGQQACELEMTMTLGGHTQSKKASKCFPGVCEAKNIKLEVEAKMPPPIKKLLKITKFECEDV